jgi:ribosomal subunit interface protein
MNLSVSGKQIDVGEALRSHVEAALADTVAKYFDRALEGAVTFSRGRHLFHCDMAVHVGRGIQMHAEGQADEIYRAFDAALERMATRLRRHKRRLRAHHARESEIETQGAAQYILPGDEREQAETANGDPVVVAEMKTKIMSLTVGEAVMHLDFGKQPALMFRNRAHGRLNMIYRRNDGTIGWVDPESAAQR